MSFIEALKEAVQYALHGDLKQAEAVLKAYFKGGQVHTDDGHTDPSGGGGGQGDPGH